MSAGKGDSPRPVRGDAYRENYDEIFRKGKRGKRRTDRADRTDLEGIFSGHLVEGSLAEFDRYIGGDR